MKDYKKLERILNDVMKRHYPWWLGITITDIEKRTFHSRTPYLHISGKLRVPEEWVEDQYYKIRDRQFYPDNYDENHHLDLGDIISVPDAKKIYDAAQYIIGSVLNLTDYEISLNYVHLDWN
jgi:hypothetical protein